MPDRDILLGVDIGGTKILVGLVDQDGKVIESRRDETRSDHLLPDTLAACANMIEAARLRGRRVKGIGIGAKGVVDRDARCLVGSLYLGHVHVPIGDALEQAFGIPVRVENDVHAATIGECIFGIGRETDDFLLFNAGTGIAVGIVVGGELYRGASNTAGENGHVVMDRSGRWPCACGLSGCMETMIVAGRQGALLPRIGLAAEGSPSDPAYGYLLTSILDLIALFDPAAVVLTGGMLANDSAAAEWIAEACAHDRALRGYGAPIPVIPAFGGIDTGLIGAAALVLRAPRNDRLGSRPAQRAGSRLDGG